MPAPSCIPKVVTAVAKAVALPAVVVAVMAAAHSAPPAPPKAPPVCVKPVDNSGDKDHRTGFRTSFTPDHDGYYCYGYYE